MSDKLTPVKFEDLGMKDYLETWNYQEILFQELMKKKMERSEAGQMPGNRMPNYLLFVEHPHVFTLGKSGLETNLLVNHLQMQAKNVSFYRTNRGGDITYHGPGQIVGYPILDLDNYGMGIREYIFRLEDSIINALKHYNISGGRIEGATGVWLDAGIPGKARKICAIGVRASRSITMHGFAFNVNTDLSYFSLINPCGYTDKSVTSLENEIGQKINIEETKKILIDELKETFRMEWVND